MRKLLVSTLAVVGFATVAVAQNESALTLDGRNNTNPGAAALNQSIATPAVPFTNGQYVGQVTCNAGNPGGLGDGQVLRIMPTHVANAQHLANRWPNWDGDGNVATGNLQLWLQVNQDTDNAPACAGDVISSIGADFVILAPGEAGHPNAGPAKNLIGSLSYAWTAAVAWNGTANGAYAGGSNGDHTGAKAVDVPVNAVPAYDTTGGAVPGGGEAIGGGVSAYRIGTLTVTGGGRDCVFGAGHVAASTYQLRMRVNNLLITRTCSNASVDPGEQVSMGYGDPFAASGCGASPELPAVNGSTSGAMSTASDAVIIVLEKGDFNNNGSTTGADNGGYFAAQAASGLGTHKQHQLYLGDFNGNTTVSGADNGGYFAAQAATAACP